MTQEQKDLLLKDLCARLPYGVKVALKNSEAYHHDNVAKRGDVTIDKLKGFNGKYFSIYHDNPLDWDWYVNDVNVGDIKPYLFPLSSMTEEQKEELNNMFNQEDDICEKIKTDNFEFSFYRKSIFDFLNKYHFDWRGLIPMGLANDATGKNIY